MDERPMVQRLCVCSGPVRVASVSPVGGPLVSLFPVKRERRSSPVFRREKTKSYLNVDKSWKYHDMRPRTSNDQKGNLPQ